MKYVTQPYNSVEDGCIFYGINKIAYSEMALKVITLSTVYEVLHIFRSGLWYDVPMAIRKMLLFVVRRNLKLSYLTAGNIFVVYLESFSTIVQTSTSYFMVLLSMN